MEVNNNIETKMIAFLNANLPSGWKAYGEIPETRPTQYVLVERTGGPADTIARIERPELIISYTHKTSQKEASNTSLAMDTKIIRDFKKLPEVSRTERLSLVRLDDLVTKERRYQGYYSFTHHLQ